MVSFKNIGDNINCGDYNALVYLLRKFKKLSKSLKFESNDLTSEYGDFHFSDGFESIGSNFILNNDVVITSDSVLQNAYYTFIFTALDVNLSGEVNKRFIEVNGSTGENSELSITIPSNIISDDEVILPDFKIEITFDLHEYSTSSIFRNICIQLINGVPIWEIDFYEDKLREDLKHISKDIFIESWGEKNPIGQFIGYPFDLELCEIIEKFGVGHILALPRYMAGDFYLVDGEDYTELCENWIFDKDLILDHFNGYIPVLIYNMPYVGLTSGEWRTDGEPGIGTRYVPPLTESEYNAIKSNSDPPYSEFDGNCILAVFNVWQQGYYLLEFLMEPSGD